MSTDEAPPQSLEDVLSVASTESTLTAVICTINAEVAQQIVSMFNSTNRKLRPGFVKLYANEMLRGKWKLNGEPLLFGLDEQGTESIISGQHRLHAVLEANKQYLKDPSKYPDAVLELHTVCIYGIDLSTADTVDQGVNRSHGDVLFRDEWVTSVIPKEWNDKPSNRDKWTKCLAHAARLVWLRQGGATVSSATKFLTSEMLEFIKGSHQHLCEFVSAILSASQEDGGGLKISIPYIAALCYVASLDENGDVIKETKNVLLDSMLEIAQLKVKPGTPEHALSAYWNDMLSKPGSNDRDLDIIGPFVKAVNAIISGTKVTVKQIRLTEKERENYKHNPPLMKGYDEHCFIRQAEIKAEWLQMAEETRAARAKAAEEKRIAAEKAKEEKEKAKAEADKAKAKVEQALTKGMADKSMTPMQALSRVIKKKPIPVATPIKRKPVTK